MRISVADTTTPTLPAALTEQQILDQARQQVNQDISAQTTPLQSQVDTLGTQRDRTLANVGTLFDHIQPTVSQSAQAVSDSYNNAETVQNNIFTAANQRLNQMRQDRAAEAQRMAQQIGGPVAVGEFTAGLDSSIEAGALLGAGQQLHTLAYGQAGVDQAQAFAGQVFPLVRTEEMAKQRSYFEDQIKNINDQITKLNSSKTGLIDSKANELRKQNLDYELQVNQQKLDSLKANRDWQATLSSLKNDEARIDLAKKQFNLDTTKTKADITHLSTADKQQAAALGLSQAEFRVRTAALAANRKLAQQKLTAAKNVTAAAYLDAAVNPQPGKTITQTIAQPVTRAVATTAIGKGNTDVYADPNSPTGYSKLAKTVNTVSMTPITDPNALVDYLVSHNVAKPKAIEMVKSRLRMPDWVYGSSPNTGVTGVGGSRH